MNPAFLWTIGYNQNLQEIKKNEKSLQKLYQQVTNCDMNLFDDYIPFGCAFFSNQITKREIIKLFNHQIIQMFRWENWFITLKDKGDISRFEKIFSYIKEAQIILLQIAGLPMPGIFRSISHIGFYQLTHLNLHSCGIVSIQPLTYIDAPNLSILNLIYNYVYDYKPLKKVNFKLDKLFLYSGKQSQINKTMSFVRLDDLSRCNFTLQGLRLEKHFYNEVIMEDLSFLSKLKHSQNVTFDINVSMSSRIFQKKLFKKYYEEGPSRLFIFQITDHRQFPLQAFNDDEFFEVFHIERR